MNVNVPEWKKNNQNVIISNKSIIALLDNEIARFFVVLKGCKFPKHNKSELFNITNTKRTCCQLQ
jgi:hypothetical protein